MPKRITLSLAALLAVSFLLPGCIATKGLSEVMRHCTAYGPLKMGRGGPGFGAAFACDTTTAKALEPR